MQISQLVPKICARPVERDVGIWARDKALEMNAVLASGCISSIFGGDGKPHPITAILALLAVFIVIFCFERWGIKK